MFTHICLVILSIVSTAYGIDTEKDVGASTWLMNHPRDFHNRSAHLGDGMVDVTADPKQMKDFESIIKEYLPYLSGSADGEVVDALEHFFWGLKHGLSIELGALDGSAKTKSQTYEYEVMLQWRRILVEGDPAYRHNLLKESPNCFSVNAAICSHHSHVHFIDKSYTGGILEFMGMDFMKRFHPDAYDAVVLNGNNVSAVDWTKHPTVKPIDCIPMSAVLHKARARHVNYFILDVEGAEMEVLNSINWSMVKFDVLCIETEPTNRPPGYAETVTEFMKSKGYIDYAGQIGRNRWYVHPDFKPHARPGIAKDCFNGARKADNADKRWWNRRHPAFEPCPLVVV